MNIIKYKLLLWKTYIMTGYSLTQLFKYAIMVFGLWNMTGEERSLMLLSLIGFAYIIFCFILGWIWFKFELVNAEIEISNQYNPLAKQLRGRFRMAKDIKSIKS